MLPDRVLNPGPLTYESGALPIALRGPAEKNEITVYDISYSIIQVHKMRPNNSRTPYWSIFTLKLTP